MCIRPILGEAQGFATLDVKVITKAKVSVCSAWHALQKLQTAPFLFDASSVIQGHRVLIAKLPICTLSGRTCQGFGSSSSW